MVLGYASVFVDDILCGELRLAERHWSHCWFVFFGRESFRWVLA